MSDRPQREMTTRERLTFTGLEGPDARIVALGLLERAERAEGRIAELEAERDKAREECGHEKAMRASLHREFDGWLAACRKGECFPCVSGGRKADRDAAVALLRELVNVPEAKGYYSAPRPRSWTTHYDRMMEKARAFLDGVSP